MALVCCLQALVILPYPFLPIPFSARQVQQGSYLVKAQPCLQILDKVENAHTYIFIAVGD
jgi:hypothetical protein